MVSYLVRFYLFKIILPLYQNHTPTLQNHTPIFTKSLADFHNITGWFSQNHTPTLPKSHSDFTKITLRFSQNHWLIFTTSLADFDKITRRLCQNHAPILPKSPTDFHKITDWFSQKRGLILKPQIVVVLYAVSKPRPRPLCVLLVRRFQQFRHDFRLSGSAHCLCPFLWKKPSVVYR